MSEFPSNIDVCGLAHAAYDSFDLARYSGASQLSILDWRAILRLRRVAMEWVNNGAPDVPKRYVAAVVERISKNPLSTLMLTDKTYPPTVTDLTVSDACGFRDSVAYSLPRLFEIVEKIEALAGHSEQVELSDATPEQITELFSRVEQMRVLEDEVSVPLRKAMNDAGVSDGLCNLVVDCSAPDDVLLADFREWLSTYRSQTGKLSKLSESDMRRWAQHQVLPYIDLKIIASIAGIETTNYSVGCKIFPGIDADVAEKVRKTTAPLADWILGPEGEEVIGAVANDAQRRMAGKNWG